MKIVRRGQLQEYIRPLSPYESTLAQELWRGQACSRIQLGSNSQVSELHAWKQQATVGLEHSFHPEHRTLAEWNNCERDPGGKASLALQIETSTAEIVSALANNPETLILTPKVQESPCLQKEASGHSDSGQAFAGPFPAQAFMEAQGEDKLCGWSDSGDPCLLSGDLPIHMASLSVEHPYRCEQCGKSFRYPAYLGKHMRTHTGERPHACPVCGKAFAQYWGLSQHVRTHSVHKPYTCKECGKAFRVSSYLAKHLQTHTDQKPYTCKQCSKAFGTSSYLQKHVRIHMGLKPYVCKECGKAFTQSSGLTKHVRSHSGEKPYQCKECGKAFTTSTCLLAHTRTHTGERPFICKQCGKAFARSFSLIEHGRTHAREKPFKCEACGKAYSAASDLTRHRRVHTESPLAETPMPQAPRAGNGGDVNDPRAPGWCCLSPAVPNPSLHGGCIPHLGPLQKPPKPPF
ncbi:zinc finger protein 121-like isoform X4 [Perognathus longimembris pacificus]|uniref:zinc finger protein 121-like isoform X4 n=1 Tax=Perognathus longimembris pacificus TaxID=214514 RepID=UPI002019D1DF|nr:zinc finger protein 121-like isoform X4 [Perognathus longimembris pacificus]XP_048198212.1 zinc finger protein 121-like isoform X4 [Perognathus longimembris pacificus]